MKYIFTTLVLLISTIAFSQINEDENGLFYNDNKELYTGNYSEFFANGQKKIEMYIKNGMKDGKVIIYLENGKIIENRSYKANKNDGLWVNYAKDGTKLAEANYKNGEKHGKWLIWDKNGTQRFEMFYNNGSKSGIWKMWSEKGELISTKEY